MFIQFNKYNKFVGKKLKYFSFFILVQNFILYTAILLEGA